MKTILYVGATLMIGASIYGFVDYKKTSRSKEFIKMYDSPKTSEPVINNDKIKEAVVKPDIKSSEKTAVVKKETTVSKTDQPEEKRKISIESFSRARPDKKSVTYEIKTEPEKPVQKGTLEKNKEQ